MSEVKVIIEWSGNTAGLHPDPRTVLPSMALRGA